MNDDHVVSVVQLKELEKLSNGVKFKSRDKKETYEWIGKALGKFRYLGESKKNRSIIKKYLITMTGYSEGQIDKLIAKKKKTGRVYLPTKCR